ncbi:4-hydroxybenzoate octaprenyltransferase [Thermogymnomonas acidicola]|uniref:4-hydroxybenzoate octaprenyltransferase n=1 Tax=Thermogymnomonas acidicola TaxID=399579 RepID=A0AA37F8N5_9ARCH|nr:UbiA-like polyprenyltransferase [Thermogymnomonas acidicola]GGM66894.1 4-hydroxybenzoate octaprenyltransferase [Thermogymnomonas acidicola]
MKAKDIVDYIKLEHTVFDLPFVFAGTVIASGPHVYPVKILLVLVATTFARATGMSVNRILGRRYDAINPRKRDWALVSGKISMRGAIALTVAFALIFELATLALNRLVLLLSPAVLALFIADPIMKRITAWRHYFMGSTIGVGVLGGYLAVRPVFPADPVLYLTFIASSLWIAGFDIIYVIPDREFDIRNGLKTLVTKYGVRKALRISEITHAVTFLDLVAIAFYYPTWAYVAVLVPILFLIVFQHVSLDPGDPRSVRRSFLGANSFIGILFFIGLVVSTWLLNLVAI